MPISVSCPSCRSVLRAPDAAAGKTLSCPKCGAKVTVPLQSKAAFTAEPPLLLAELDEQVPRRPRRSKQRREPDESARLKQYLAIGAVVFGILLLPILIASYNALPHAEPVATKNRWVHDEPKFPLEARASVRFINLENLHVGSSGKLDDGAVVRVVSIIDDNTFLAAWGFKYFLVSGHETKGFADDSRMRLPDFYEVTRTVSANGRTYFLLERTAILY